MASEKRGSISFFSTYRPPVALAIFSCLVPPTSKGDEAHLTDGRSYNYNGRVIPPAALKHPKLTANCEGEEAGVKSGPRSGMVFVSERTGLETLHLALYPEENLGGKVRVVGLQHLFPDTFSGVRMEDSGCFVAGSSLVYVSTKQPAAERRQPWTAVYSTHLGTGETKRLTPPGVADLSPSVSPSGNTIAVASFQRKTGGWDGEIEDLKTNIYVMDVANPSDRKLVVTNGGWPTWGSDDVLFFHRKVGKFWSVFRVDVRNLDAVTRVTPESISAMTPAAVDATTVAVATIRQTSSFSDVRVEDQYRHIEIFDSTGSKPSVNITQNVRPLADHFNPFVIDGGKRIGYHCAKSKLLKEDEVVPSSRIDKLVSPYPNIKLFRLLGPFPAFKKDSSTFAYVDNEFKALWVADSKPNSKNKKLSIIFDGGYADKVFSPVWNRDPAKDTLYVCMGPSFQEQKIVDICAFTNVSHYLGTGKQPPVEPLIVNGYNNAFPSTNPDGTKLVFRSNMNGVNGGKKNIQESIHNGGRTITKQQNNKANRGGVDRHALPMVPEWRVDRVLVVPGQARWRTGIGQRPGRRILRGVPGEVGRPVSGGEGDDERKRYCGAREPSPLQPGQSEHRRDFGSRRGVRGSHLSASVHALREALRRHLHRRHRPE